MDHKRRVFLIVLDSVGIGEMPDSAQYGDEGSNTLAACTRSDKLDIPNLPRNRFSCWRIFCPKQRNVIKV